MRNGLVVATEVMLHLRSVSIGVWVKCGSRFESDGSTGISHFIEHLLFKGTRTRSAQEIAQAIDSVGGQLNAFTDKEYVGFYARVLDDHVSFAFELLSDIVLNPTFPAIEMKRERNVIFEEINMVEDSPQELIHEVFLENFWKGHPLGRPISGTKESVVRIRRKQVVDFFTSKYTACNTLIAVAGNIRHRKVQQLAERFFSNLETGTPNDPGPPPTVHASRDIRLKPNLEQTHILLGVVSPPVVSEDRFIVHLLSNVLGGGVSSRLFQNIREKRGLVYSIYSSLNLYRDAGSLVLYAGTAANSAAAVADLMAKEMKALREKLVPPGELKRCKENVKGSVMLSLESSSARMTHLAQQQIYYGRFYKLQEVLDSIDRVRAKDIRRLANDIFDASCLTITSLGGEESRPLESVSLRI